MSRSVGSVAQPCESVRIHLPAGYDPAGTTRSPVIYFFHGRLGDHAAYWWLLKPALDDLIGAGQIQACVMVG